MASASIFHVREFEQRFHDTRLGGGVPVSAPQDGVSWTGFIAGVLFAGFGINYNAAGLGLSARTEEGRRAGPWRPHGYLGLKTH